MTWRRREVTALSRLATMLVALATCSVAGALASPPEVPAAYPKLCASCHGADRLGGLGPALLPDSLQRLKKEDARQTIALGRPATQMPGFGEQMNADEIAALVDFIYAPPATQPRWTLADMRASQVVHVPLDQLPEQPTFTSDPLNLFTVVEAGDQHVTILDGDRLEPLARFPSHYALHGGAKYSPDGRFVYLGSRDGWVTKYDLYSLQAVADIRAGINLRNIAVSANGRYVMVGNFLPREVVILDARDLTPLKIIPALDRFANTSRVSAVYTAKPRQSFLVALKDSPEMWEISYRDNPEPQAKGFVHSYQPGMVEGAFDVGPFPVRRIALDDVLDDFFFDPDYRNAIGAGRQSKLGQVINLNVGRPIATVDLEGMPHLASGIVFDFQGTPVLATPILNQPAIAVIDMRTWRPIKRIVTAGPGFFLRSHENTPYAWTDNSLGMAKDQLQIIDKRTLEVVRTIVPAPGKTAAHVEFTRDGRYALVSVSEMDGALVVYDANTFAEVKRLPMSKPSGKYNVFNKISLSSGTSH